MKKRNREEVYTSSTRSTPRGKRLLSWLLSMVMLLALLPATEIHVHAAYEDGMECPGCGHYHWDENCCGNCGACTRECDDDCYEETHCINDCGACRADGNFACDCGYCYDCARQEEPEKLAALEKAVELKLIDGYCLGDLTDRQARAWLDETVQAMQNGHAR